MPHNDGRKTGKNGKGLGVGRRKGDKSIHNPGDMTSERAKKIRAKDDPEKKRLGGIKQSATKNAKATLQRVTTETQDFLRQQLLTPDEFGHIYVHDLISSFLAEAKENPNSRAASFLAQSMFTPDLLAKLDADANNAMNKDLDFARYRIRSLLYDKQQQVFDDPYDHIMTVCGRRAGKTILNSRLLIKYALKPNTPCLYVNLSFDNAVRQMWDELIKVANSIGFGIKQATKASGFIDFDNGSSIQFRGNNNKAAIDLVRGYHYGMCILDEIQGQCQIRYAIDDVLEPALRDNKGTLLLSGTPPRDNFSMVKELWDSGRYHTYNWNMTDNPYILDHENAIKEICEQKKRTEDDPLIQREYFGRFVTDTESKIYDVKTYKEIPKTFVPKSAYIGVDTGFTDYNGICTLIAGYDNNNFKVYITDEHKFNHSTIQYISECVKQNIEKVKNIPYQVIVDQASHQIAYELSQTYGIDNVYCSYKYDEATSISQLQDLFKAEIILAPEGGTTEYESQRIMWKRDIETDELLCEVDDDNFHADLMDAVRYASRQIIFEYSDELNNIIEGNIPKSATEA